MQEIYYSPAKINLFFRVLCRRPDGYHEIASLMQAIDLCDQITIVNAPHDILTCSDPALPCDDSNLVMRALKLFRKHYELNPVHIHLDKRIPMQSGLGGGSSNAATILWALNERIHKRMDGQKLCAMGAQLGSDVPFFFSQGSAYCTGRGEIVEPCSISPLKGILAKPFFGLSTPDVYRETRVSELEPIDPIIARNRFQESQPLYFNDLEPAAFRLEPRLIQFKQAICSRLTTPVVMTGSGTAFFTLTDGNMSELRFVHFQSIARNSSHWYQ